MKYSWFKTVFPISAIFSFRMLGLFLLIPVFTVSAADLRGATPTLIGFALGVYGLSQGVLQMPFGILSDKLGRKPILTLGLVLFTIGSLWGALTDSIYGMIIARTLQGTGAIGSVLIALLSDLTPDEQRTKAMAVIGMTIGTSFSLAMVISPAITHYFGLSGIFYLTAILAISGMILIHTVIPTPTKEKFHADTEANSSLLKPVIRNRHLQRLNAGIFCQHFILTATFYAIPLLLKQQMHLGHLTRQWHFYLPLMLCSFILMIPFIILAEKKRRMKTVFVLAVLFTTIAQGLLTLNSEYWYSLCLLMFVYFVAFNILEASLPSLVSKQASPNAKGTAMGIYSTSQFLGIFAGGACAGILYQWQGNQAIFLSNMMLGIIWLIISLKMNPNMYLSTLILHCENFADSTHLREVLLSLNGVKDVSLSEDEQVVYLRVDKQIYVPGAAEKCLANLK